MTQIRDIISAKISGEWGREATPENSVYVIRTADFTNDGKIKYDQLVRRNIDPNKIKKKRLKYGDVIIEKSGGSPNQPVGRVVFFDKDEEENYLCNNFTAILRPAPSLIPKFFFYSLYYNYLVGKTRPYQNVTAGIINLKLDLYLSEHLYLPDLTTQRQVVTALDKAKALIEKRNQSLEALDKLQRATFINFFGDPVFNPKEWKVKELGNLLSEIDSGWSPECEKSNRQTEEQWAVLKLSSVTYRRFNPEENKLLPVNTTIKKKVIPERGDVLFSRKNTLELVGASAYIFRSTKKLLLPDTIFKLRYKPEELNGIYLWYLLNDLNFRKLVQRLASGATQSMSNISKQKLKALNIPTPPLTLQQEFGELIIKSEKIRSKFERSLREIETIFQSLLQRAFYGNLTVDTELQLDGLLKNRNFSAIEKDVVLILSLVDRFNTAKLENFETLDESDRTSFETKASYDCAKEALFHLLKSGRVFQYVEVGENKSIRTRLKLA